MVKSTNPVVPSGPEMVKLSSLLVELKARAETVEFETTEKTFCSLKVFTESILVDIAGYCGFA